MHHFGFASEQRDIPSPADPGRAALGLERWRDAAAEAEDPETGAFAEAAAADPAVRRLLAALFGNSPFLTQCVASDPGFACQLLTGGPDDAYDRVMKGLGEPLSQTPPAEVLAGALRIAKRRIALAVAVADIAGVWPLERVTAALSDFAEAALGHAARCVLTAAAGQGAFELAEPGDPERDSGLVVLAMGKLGARELNYSSDIDLIVLYDAERVRTGAPDDLQKHFIRLTRNMVRLIDERTADGYVFRTDLRLRPDPGAMPLAISVLAAETYYESMGQNWERAAMIKARPVAGDRRAGAAFLEKLKPFIWRKNLDFAAIRDIHSIKRQINAHRGGGKIALRGHNIKLGRGGIREIEFFVQTQQLIWGGRQPGLRRQGTGEMLGALAEGDLISARAAQELASAYRYLRRVEHRLQMVDDEQTQTLPQDGEGLTNLATFLGYADVGAFGSEILSHLGNVETHYAALFEDAPSLGAQGDEAGNLVFTGGEADPDTLDTIKRLGFKDSAIIDEAVRGWHHGRYRSTRSARTREMLTELTPMLLRAFAGAANSDAAFLKFDEFLSRLPAGIQLFSMFYSNPHLLDLVAEIMGGASRLADHLSRTPSILDSVLGADFFAPPPPPESLDGELSLLLEGAGNPEEILDISRRWANDRKFQAGVQSLRGHLSCRGAQAALSNIAASALKCLQPHIEEEFAARHGRFEGSGMAILAMGKLGGGEMTPSSDLDLIFVYASGEEAGASDGRRPLPPSQYFARLSQRLINALTAPTAEGKLYEVDMRLRPSGNAGPIASSLEAFVQYHDEEAWTWEHMALTRARVIAGPAGLRQKVEGVIADTLTRPRDLDRLRGDVAEMRARMEMEKHTDFIWDVKFRRGGLVDIEFIAQYLQLKHAHGHREILSPSIRTALKRIRDAGLLETAKADHLIEALDLWHAIQGLLRLTIEGDVSREWENGVPGEVRDTLARHCGAVDFTALKDKIELSSGRVYGYFTDLIGEPAGDIAGERQTEENAR